MTSWSNRRQIRAIRRDSLLAIGCEITNQPDLKDEALAEQFVTQSRRTRRARNRVTEPMLDAGPVKTSRARGRRL